MGEMLELAKKNLVERLKDNPCRGVVVGRMEDGNAVQMSWIMGRSPNSQNRVYVAEKDVLRTEAADESKVDNPELIIYTAMKAIVSNFYAAHIVSNGDQTDSLWSSFADDGIHIGAFADCMLTRYCEPDAPTFTARITGYTSSQKMHTANLSVLRASPIAKELWLDTIAKQGLKRDDFESPEAFNAVVGKYCGLSHRAFPTIRSTFQMPVKEGFGYCITTYAPGGKTLPPFEGEPFLVPIQGDIEEVTGTFWAHLEPEWKVALGAKLITDNKSYEMQEPINRFDKVTGD